MTDIISKEHRTTSDDLARPAGEQNTMTTGTDKTVNPPSGGEPDQSQSADADLPPQLHAGKVGYGPNYHQGPTTGEKFTGLKEEVVGKVKKDQNLTQHGHDLRTGELKRREEAEDLGSSAFDKPDQNQSETEPAPGSTPSKTESNTTNQNSSSVYTEGENMNQKRVGEDSANLGSRAQA